MLGHYLVLIISFLFYQATVGGLFFILAKAASGNSTYTTVLLMIEPCLMLIVGVNMAKWEDMIRSKYTPWYYMFLSLITTMSFLSLYILLRRDSDLRIVLIPYTFVILAFMMEKIYRQRLPRDFSTATGIDHGRVNAVTNLANRGAPVLAPFAVLLFSDGINAPYLILFILSSIAAAVLLSNLMTQISPAHTLLEERSMGEKHYPSELIGRWHILHLFLMNLVLGGLFMVLAQSVLTEITTISFLQGPSGFFAGFWSIMAILSVFQGREISTPYMGLFYIGLLGLALMLSTLGGPFSVIMLCVAGCCYGFSINQLGTFIQRHLDYSRYSYYETRAQTFGRLALLFGLMLTGWGLNLGYSPELMRGIMGLGAFISTLILSTHYKTSFRKHALLNN